MAKPKLAFFWLSDNIFRFQRKSFQICTKKQNAWHDGWRMEGDHRPPGLAARDPMFKLNDASETDGDHYPQGWTDSVRRL